MSSSHHRMQPQQQQHRYANPLDSHRIPVSMTSSNGAAVATDRSHNGNANSNSSNCHFTKQHKRELEKEKSSVSTDSSVNSVSGATTTTNNCAGANSSSKLSKIGRRLRDSCRNLRVKSGSASSSGNGKCNPEDFGAVKADKESNRSKHYVAMDFSGKVGRICSEKDIKGFTSKDGYAYFRRKVLPKEVIDLLTESQSQIHLGEPWFHRGLSRDVAQKILATHNVDGAFLVRDSSVAGGFVISYVAKGRTFHAQVLPDAGVNPTTGTRAGSTAFYSLDEGKTRFYDIMQMVEFYTLNQGALNTRLSQYIVKKPPPETVSSMDEEDSGRGISYDMASTGGASSVAPINAASVGGEGNGKGSEDVRSESSESRRSYASSASSSGCEASMDSQTGATHAEGRQNGEERGERPKKESSSSSNGFGGGSNLSPDSFPGKGEKSKTTQDANHNTTVAAAAAGGASVEAAAAAEDAAMASEGDSDSMREFHQG